MFTDENNDLVRLHMKTISEFKFIDENDNLVQVYK